MSALLLPTTSIAKTIKVAVIDTGYDFKSTWKDIDRYPGLKKPKICTDSRHADFTKVETDKTYLEDTHGHGTHIAGLIASAAGDSDYCLVIIKYYNPYHNNLKATIKSFEHAIEENVDIINYSGGGTDYSAEEYEVLMRAIKLGIKVVVAAGNEKSNIDEKGKHYYPASYSPLITSVGNVDEKGKRVPSSNYGDSVTAFRMGLDVYSLLPGNRYGTMTGTSQATAIRSGEIVKELYKLKNFDSFNPRKYLKSYKTKLAC